MFLMGHWLKYLNSNRIFDLKKYKTMFSLGILPKYLIWIDNNRMSIVCSDNQNKLKVCWVLVIYYEVPYVQNKMY